MVQVQRKLSLIMFLIVLLAAPAIRILVLLVLLTGALTASALLATLVLDTLTALLASLILILILRHYISPRYGVYFRH